MLLFCCAVAVKRLEELVASMKKVAVTGLTAPAKRTKNKRQPPGSANQSTTRNDSNDDAPNEPVQLIVPMLEVDPIDLGARIPGSVFKKMNDTSQKDSWKKRKSALDELRGILDEEKEVRFSFVAFFSRGGLMCGSCFG